MLRFSSLFVSFIYLLCSLYPSVQAWEWDIPVSSGAPLSRYQHTMVTYVQPSTGQLRILVCGGSTLDSSNNNEPIYVPPGCYSLDPFHGWNFVRVITNNDTAPRKDHTMVAYQTHLLIYGGIISPNSTQYYSPTDCEIISLSTWKPIKDSHCDLGDVPVSRWGHTAVQYMDQWIIYGGATLPQEGQDSIDLDDAIILDLTSGPNFTWYTPFNILNTPPARHYHAAAVHGNTMVVYGGYSIENDDVLDDLWIVPLDGPNSWTWTNIAPTGNVPTPLYGHRAVVVNDLFVMFGGQIAIVGGIHAIDLSDNGAVWTTPTIDGGWTDAPFLASVAAFDSDGDSDPELVVFGGKEAGLNGKVTNGLAVLSQIGENPIPISQSLPFIITGSAVGGFLLLGLGYFAYRRSHTLALRKAKEAQEAEEEGRGPLLSGNNLYNPNYDTQNIPSKNNTFSAIGNTTNNISSNAYNTYPLQREISLKGNSITLPPTLAIVPGHESMYLEEDNDDDNEDHHHHTQLQF